MLWVATFSSHWCAYYRNKCQHPIAKEIISILFRAVSSIGPQRHTWLGNRKFDHASEEAAICSSTSHLPIFLKNAIKVISDSITVKWNNTWRWSQIYTTNKLRYIRPTITICQILVHLNRKEGLLVSTTIYSFLPPH